MSSNTAVNISPLSSSKIRLRLPSSQIPSMTIIIVNYISRHLIEAAKELLYHFKLPPSNGIHVYHNIHALVVIFLPWMCFFSYCISIEHFTNHKHQQGHINCLQHLISLSITSISKLSHDMLHMHYSDLYAP